MEKLFAALLIGTLLVPTPLVYAQEATDTPAEPAPVVEEQVADTTPPAQAPETPQETTEPTDTQVLVDVQVAVESSVVVETGVVDIQATSTDLQDTTNTQPAVTSEVLEGTVNPDTTTTTDTESTPVSQEATTTPETPVESEPVDTVPLEEATTTLDIVADLPPTPEVAPQEALVQAVALPEEDLEPDPQFAFALTGSAIPSKKILKDKNGRKIGEQAVTGTVQTSIDNTKGVISVSGQCSDVYFVILLYRKQNDYADDPSSYLVNRAYPCVNGRYAYEISELPHNLENGTYYLLVGQEGNTGTWTPITGLTEITINQN